MPSTKILAIAKELRAVIPAPRRPTAKTQKTWATLTVGRLLKNLKLFQVGTVPVPRGTIFTVEKTTNQGAWLRNPLSDVEIILTDKNWRKSGEWETQRRPSKARKKGTTK